MPPAAAPLPTRPNPSSDAAGSSGQETPGWLREKRRDKGTKRKAKEHAKEQETGPSPAQLSRRRKILLRSQPLAHPEYSANDSGHTLPSYIGVHDTEEDYGPRGSTALERVAYLQTIGYEITICDSP